MHSKITIEVDLEASTPFFKVIVDKTSEDIRDQLVRKFREKFSCISNWCRAKFDDTAVSGNFMFTIEPIPPHHLPEELKMMKLVVDHMEDNPVPSL